MYLICLVLSGTLEWCVSASVVTGWQFCADQAVSPGGLLVDSDAPGRFQSFDSNEECGLLGCPAKSGRYDRKYVLRTESGFGYATVLEHDGKRFADDFEDIDLNAESSCVFSRVL